MRLFQKPGSPYWWYDFSIDVKRYRASTKRAVKAEANRVMNEEYTKLQNVAQLGEKPEITLEDAFDRTLKTVDGNTKRVYEIFKRKWTGGPGFEDK